MSIASVGDVRAAPDLAVVVLTGEEERHIGRCLERLLPLEPRAVFVVDSLSRDGGPARVRAFAAAQAGRMAVSLVPHAYPGCQAVQFQWALDNLPLETEWILRLDADEYLTDELIAEIRARLPALSARRDVDGVILKRRHVVGWLGDRWIRRGMYPTRILRLFRRGHGRSDLKLMDEHIVVDGAAVEFDGDFVDHSLITFDEWRAKHRRYAEREARSVREGERSTGAKAAAKSWYYRLPPYVRAFAYFAYRYFAKGGFLEGVAGARWHFWHALWYRWTVDRELSRKTHRG